MNQISRRTLLGIHPSMMNELTEEWSRPFRMRLGEKHQDGTRDIEFQPVEITDVEALESKMVTMRAALMLYADPMHWHFERDGQVRIAELGKWRIAADALAIVSGGDDEMRCFPECQCGGYGYVERGPSGATYSYPCYSSDCKIPNCRCKDKDRAAAHSQALRENLRVTGEEH